MYPKVKIYNTSFEEWRLEANKFNAVLSANAFHWLTPAIAYPKAAQALQKNGFLILLWNLTPEPKYEVYQALENTYKAYVPSLARYEGVKIQTNILKNFGQNILDSGCFKNLVCEQKVCEVTYGVEEYLTLLSTLRKLDPITKELLFIELRKKLQHFGDSIKLSFLSAIQIAQISSST